MTDTKVTFAAKKTTIYASCVVMVYAKFPYLAIPCHDFFFETYGTHSFLLIVLVLVPIKRNFPFSHVVFSVLLIECTVGFKTQSSLFRTFFTAFSAKALDAVFTARRFVVLRCWLGYSAYTANLASVLDCFSLMSLLLGFFSVSYFINSAQSANVAKFPFVGNGSEEIAGVFGSLAPAASQTGDVLAGHQQAPEECVLATAA